MLVNILINVLDVNKFCWIVLDVGYEKSFGNWSFFEVFWIELDDLKLYFGV